MSVLVPLLTPLPGPVVLLLPEPEPVGLSVLVGSSVLVPVPVLETRSEELDLMREHLGAEAEARVGRRSRGRRGRTGRRD